MPQFCGFGGHQGQGRGQVVQEAAQTPRRVAQVALDDQPGGLKPLEAALDGVEGTAEPPCQAPLAGADQGAAPVLVVEQQSEDGGVSPGDAPLSDQGPDGAWQGREKGGGGCQSVVFGVYWGHISAHKTS
jgi:hypothetical protein